MNRLKLFAALIALVAIIGSCTKEEHVPANRNTTYINFENPVIGQKSLYLGFTGASVYGNDNPGISYFDQDTLNVEITAKIDDTYILEEYMSSNPDSSRTYGMELKNGTVTFIKNEGDQYLFSWLLQVELTSENELRLSLEELNENKGVKKGWSVDLGCLECTGYLENHEQLGHIYPKLNIWKNFTPTSYDGPGYDVIYSAPYGIVRTSALNPWTGAGGGFDLILKDD